MLLDAGMGHRPPSWPSKKHPLSGNETAASLTEDLFRLGAQLLLDDLEKWITGNLPACPQDNSVATVTKKLERADGWADWNLPAAELERRRRAFTPWPGLSTNWQGKSLRLLDVAALAGPLEKAGLPAAEPGQVVSLPLPDTPVGIGTAQGILALKTAQLEGRRARRRRRISAGLPELHRQPTLGCAWPGNLAPAPSFARVIFCHLAQP